MLERLDLDDLLIPNQHLAFPGSSEMSYTSSLAAAPERIMLLTTQGQPSLLAATVCRKGMPQHKENIKCPYNLHAQ